MDISKKELLKVTGISYGQLYRWKREGLIPEEWFMRRSAFTGQETFFPKEKILPRIQSILELKERYSLEELAQMLNEYSEKASAPPQTDKISRNDLQTFDDFPPQMKLVLSELCHGECDSARLLLLAGVASFCRTLPLSLTETKALVSSAMQLSLDGLPELILRIWSGERPHYFLTLHGDGSLFFMDKRFTLVSEVSLKELSSTLQIKFGSHWRDCDSNPKA